MSETRVVHVNDNIEGASYIGRAMPRLGLKASVFANHYRVKEHGRGGAVVRFSDDLSNAVRAGVHIEELIALRGKALACWCRHDGEIVTERNLCHGDAIVATLNHFTDEQLRAMAVQQ